MNSDRCNDQDRPCGEIHQNHSKAYRTLLSRQKT
jgi:hypothetical protein